MQLPIRLNYFCELLKADYLNVISLFMWKLLFNHLTTCKCFFFSLKVQICLIVSLNLWNPYPRNHSKFTSFTFQLLSLTTFNFFSSSKSSPFKSFSIIDQNKIIVTIFLIEMMYSVLLLVKLNYLPTTLIFNDITLCIVYLLLYRTIFSNLGLAHIGATRKGKKYTECHGRIAEWGATTSLSPYSIEDW